MVEQPAVNRRVAGSSPASGANFAEQNSENGFPDTVLTQDTAGSEKEVKFPKRIKYRGQTLAVIYRPAKNYPLYRVAWTVAQKRQMKGFARYGEAKRHADELVKDLAKGSAVSRLTPGQATDALLGLERLREFYKGTGRDVSLAAAASEFCEAQERLGSHTLAAAVEGFLTTVAVVKAKGVAQAVEEYLATKQPDTKPSGDGKRSALSPKYFYNLSIMLRRFAKAFPSTDTNGLTKEHLDAFFSGLGKGPLRHAGWRAAVSPKVRNHHRVAVRQFLNWCAKKDFLPITNRLLEADSMTPQADNGSVTEFYSPAEFKALLEASSGPLRAMIAIGGLAGLRTAELLRLTWEDVRRVENHIEVTAEKAKTRQRRLVQVVPALAQWLALFGEFSGKIWTKSENIFQAELSKLCCAVTHEVKGRKMKVTRKANGLRHSFCSFHYALHANESLTAQQAGNSPAMIHGHYKGLATQREAEGWFSVSPLQPANVVSLSNQAATL